MESVKSKIMDLSINLSLGWLECLFRRRYTNSVIPLCFLFLITCLNGLYAQPIVVQGKVVSAEDGNPLYGVSVIIKGEADGTTTDKGGNYRIQAASHHVLIFSNVGYLTKDVAIQERTVIDVELEPQISALDEVVVVGYGTVQKRDLTGSVSRVSSSELEAIPVFNAEQALKARASGVQVTQNSGAPGGRIEVRIRGGNSMIGGNEPLYVVDGFPVTDGINYLNPADIESIDVLKDASATAIYGARGANGVVIITLKRGKKTETSQINLNSSFGIQREINRYKVLGPKQYAVVANEWLKNEGREPFFNLDEVSEQGTDWQELIFRDAPIQDHTLTISGSGPATRYSLSGNYFDQQGIVRSSYSRRGNVRLNLDHELNQRFTLGVNLVLGTRDFNVLPFDNASFGLDFLSGHLAAPPTLRPYDEEGIPTRIEHIYSFGSQDMRNPLIFMSPRKSRRLNHSIVGNTTLDYKITEKLTVKTMIGLQYDIFNIQSYIPKIFEDDQGSAAYNYSYSYSLVNENTLNYSTAVGNHNIDLVGGVTYQNYMTRNIGISVSQFVNNHTADYDLGAAALVNPPSSGVSEWKLLSGIGRINYSYLGRYLLTGSFRADGSSRFGQNNKWGYFPSIAMAWRISDENFMDALEFISDFKLRSSYGMTGNTALSPYQSLSRILPARVVYGNQSEVVGYYPSSVGNADLKWESTAQFDAGLDLAMMDQSIVFTVDYYRKVTSNLLASVPLPTSTGFGAILQNVGKIENRGVEFSIQADLVNRENIKWDIFAQLSSNRNNVLSLAGNSDILGGALSFPFNGPANIARVGQPFGAFYGLVEDGLTDDGLIKYVDENNDGIINASDRVILGSPYPDFVYSLNNNLSYKNFGLNIFIEGVQGNGIFWGTAGTFLNSFQRGHNQFVDLMGNYWSEENPDPNAKYPKISSRTTHQVSDRFIEDGSYIRLKSITLSYDFQLKNRRFAKAQLFVTGINLFTITDYSGLDPEVNTRGADSGNIGGRLVMGIDQNGYPGAKSTILGVRLGF